MITIQITVIDVDLNYLQISFIVILNNYVPVVGRGGGLLEVGARFGGARGGHFHFYFLRFHLQPSTFGSHITFS